MLVRVGRPAIAAIAAIIVLALSAGSAAAAPGDLTYQGCITGQTESGSAGSGACDEIANATSSGTGSGLNWVESVTVSPDGRSLYAALGQTAHGVARFDRDPATGTLTYQGCFTGDLSITACTPTPDATADGNNSGLEAIESVAVSPDGRVRLPDEPVRRRGRHASIRNADDRRAAPTPDCVTGDSRSDRLRLRLRGRRRTATRSGFDDMKIKSVGGQRATAGSSTRPASSIDSIVTFESRHDHRGAHLRRAALPATATCAGPVRMSATATAGGARVGAATSRAGSRSAPAMRTSTSPTTPTTRSPTSAAMRPPARSRSRTASAAASRRHRASSPTWRPPTATTPVSRSRGRSR